MQLVFASRNTNKIQELQLLLPETIQLLSLTDIGCTEDIPETAETIEGNAKIKADYVTAKYGYNCFADDSGLEVTELGGLPGVHSARFAGNHKNDEDNMELLLNKLQNAENREAQFKTVITLNLDGAQHSFTGIVKGSIIHEKRGVLGFGYDPLFVAIGQTQTFAELSMAEKSKISHRGLAVKQLIEFLNKLNI